MKKYIHKQGNGLSSHPEAVRRGSRLRENSAADVTIPSAKLVVTIESQRISIEELARRITSRNRHSEVETGKAVGNEVW
ncbi:MAG TPA: hypothetical protein VNN08_00675 [Thermoanaerobaculia bacterium]|nr:hypothetical protein [Thermoanaerobaculia bacterium]